MCGSYRYCKNIIVILTCVIFLSGCSSLKEISNSLSAPTSEAAKTSATAQADILHETVYAKQGNRIYYSNPYDNKKLYAMDENLGGRTKLCDDQVRNLTLMGDWIYYTNKIDGTGLFRINKNGGEPEKITGDAIETYAYDDYWIYYINISDSGKLYKMKPDGTQRRKLGDDTAISTLKCEGDFIYYFCFENYKTRICRINKDGTQRLVLSGEDPGDFYNFFIEDDWIYYSGIESGIIKIRIDGSQTIKLDSGEACQFYISGGWIYYSINGYYDDIVYRIRPDGSGREDIITDESQADKVENTENNAEGNTKGNYANLGLVAEQGEWIYFSNLSDGFKLYKMKEDGTMKTKLSNDRVFYISILDGWVYYIIRPEQGVSNGGMAYKITTRGKSKTPIADTPSASLQIADGWLYITGEYASGVGMFRIKPDGTEKMQLGGSPARYCIGNGTLYYSERPDYGINSVPVEGIKDYYEVRNIALGLPISFLADNGWIYYGLGSQGGRDPGVYKIKTNRTGYIKLTGDEPDSLNISGDWIYYTSGQGLYKMKTDGTSRSKLCDNAAGCVNIAGDWIYYTDKNPWDAGAGFFRVKSDGTGKQEVK